MLGVFLIEEYKFHYICRRKRTKYDFSAIMAKNVIGKVFDNSIENLE